MTALLSEKEREAVTVALVAYEEADESVGQAYAEALAEATSTAQRDAAYAAYEKGINVAYATLAETLKSAGPLPTWIAEHCLNDNPIEAVDVLEILSRGGDLADVDEFAHGYGWCGDYWSEDDGYRGLVVKAGLVTE